MDNIPCSVYVVFDSRSTVVAEFHANIHADHSIITLGCNFLGTETI